jgi:yecA family protein
MRLENILVVKDKVSEFINQLDLVLTSHKAFPLIKLDGFLAAVISSPNYINMKKWMKVAKIPSLDLNSFQLLIQLYKTIYANLNNNSYLPLINSISPKSSWTNIINDHVTWAKGYITGYKLWLENIVTDHIKSITPLLSPIANFLEKATKVNLDYGIKDTKQIESLPTAVVAIYEFWSKQATVARYKKDADIFFN